MSDLKIIGGPSNGKSITVAELRGSDTVIIPAFRDRAGGPDFREHRYRLDRAAGVLRYEGDVTMSDEAWEKIQQSLYGDGAD